MAEMTRREAKYQVRLMDQRTAWRAAQDAMTPKARRAMLEQIDKAVRAGGEGVRYA